jgi:hypothetical protein
MIEPPMWMNPYLEYLIQQELPEDPTEARCIICHSTTNQVNNGELYKHKISAILQRCITPEDGRSILIDIHEGIWGHHASNRALVAKALRTGFYWPTTMQDAKDLVKVQRW